MHLPLFPLLQCFNLFFHVFNSFYKLCIYFSKCFWLHWVFVRVQASHRRACSGCRAPALGSRVQELRFTSLVTPQHEGSSGTRDRTHVPCMGRWILNHWTTREILSFYWVTNMLNSEAIQMSKIHSLLSRISAE